MVDASSNQNATKLRRGIVILLVLAIVVYAGISIYNKTQKNKIITWDGVPTALETAVKSTRYMDGGVYLSDPNKLKTIAGDVQRDAYSYRLVIDFLCSLTPEQTSYFQHNQTLPFNKLNNNQQKTLAQIRASRIEKGQILSSSDANKSYVFLGIQDKQSYFVTWLLPINKNESGQFFWMMFSKDGNARFMFPYRPYK